MKVYRHLSILILSVICVFCVQFIGLADLWASPYITFHVDGTNGSDANDGTSWAKAFKTISRGVGALLYYNGHQPPVARQLLIAEGEYFSFGATNKENIIDVKNLTGTAEYPVIIRGVGDVKVYGYNKPYADYNLGEEWVLNRWGVDTKYSVIGGLDAKYVWFENIHAIGAQYVVKFEGSTVYQALPYEERSHHIVFADCTFQNTTHYLGFFIGYRLHDYYFFNNKWIGNFNPAYGGQQHLIYWNAGKSGFENSFNLAWIGNEFSFGGRWGIQINAALVYNVALLRNIFRHNEMGGVQAMQIHHALIENNLFYESGLMDLVLWIEEDNYWNQKYPDNKNAPEREPEPVHHVRVRNNTFYKRDITLYHSYWWNACPNKNDCWHIKDETTCANTPNCYWYEPTNWKQCSTNGVPWGLGCYGDRERWEGSTSYQPYYQPDIKITIDSSGSNYYSKIHGKPLYLSEDFHDIVLENNIFSTSLWAAITWERTDPNCSGCNNHINNNLFHQLNPDKLPGVNVFKDKTQTEWYSLQSGAQTFSELFVDNEYGNPRYVKEYTVPALIGLWPEDLNDIYNPNTAPQSLWLKDYPSYLPGYKHDKRYDFHYNIDSDAIDKASASFPDVDLDLVPRPMGDKADVGPYEFVKDDCPNDPHKTGPGVCGCGVADDDSDGDGTEDCIDECPSDKGKTKPGICGCGVPDVDSDGDGVMDCLDECPKDKDKTEPGLCGCGVADTDSDGDGVPDCLEEGAEGPDNGDDGNNGGNGDNNNDLEATKAGAVTVLKSLKKALKKYKKNEKKAKQLKKKLKKLLVHFESMAFGQTTLYDAYSLQINVINKRSKKAIKKKYQRKRLCKQATKAIKILIGMLGG